MLSDQVDPPRSDKQLGSGAETPDMDICGSGYTKHTATYTAEPNS